jgi:beta-xylosidase
MSRTCNEANARDKPKNALMLRRRRGPLLVVALVALTAAFAFAPAQPAPALVEVPAGTYRNPVIARDFPDPHVFRSGRTYVATATNAYGPNIQLLTSTDLKNWVLYQDALPNLPPWAVPGRTWAPTMVKTSAGYVIYYTARHRTGGIPCIGRAVGPTAIGPFADPNPIPLVCQSGYRHGSIDPSAYIDKYGRPWLVWKSEGTPMIEPTRIWSRPLRYDGLEFEGSATELLHTDQAWEGPIIENPSFVYAGGKLLLFYSGGRWQDGSYGINWAHCHGLAGPCTKNLGPWVGSGPNAAGPGAQDFFRDPSGKLWMSYHAWSPARIGYESGGVRSLRIDRVVIENGAPVLKGPTLSSVPFG